jgi:hypothetical protein
MSFSAFFYETLMHPSILTRVIKNNGSHLRVCPAVLMGYTRHQVEDCDYPGIVPYEIGHKSFDRKLNRDERCVRGVLVDGLTESDMQLLDIFEGDVSASIGLLTSMSYPPSILCPEEIY